MAAFSSYLADQLLDHVLRGEAYSAPSNVYVSLHTGDPGGTGANEVSGGSYSRQQASFPSASSGSTSNDSNLDFAGMPSTTVSHYGVWDAASGGNFLYGGAADSSTSVDSGETYRIPSGDLTIEHD